MSVSSVDVKIEDTKDNVYDEVTHINNFKSIIVDVTKFNKTNTNKLYDCNNKLLTGDGKSYVLRRTVENFTYGYANFIPYPGIEINGTKYFDRAYIYQYDETLKSSRDVRQKLLDYINANNLTFLGKYSWGQFNAFNTECYIDSSLLDKDDCGVDIKMKADNPEKYPYEIIDTVNNTKFGYQISAGGTNELPPSYTIDETNKRINFTFNNQISSKLNMFYTWTGGNQNIYLPHLNVPYYIVYYLSDRMLSNSYVTKPDGTLSYGSEYNYKAYNGSIYKVTYSLEEVTE